MGVWCIGVVEVGCSGGGAVMGVQQLGGNV